ncbi:RNA polymerase factor sigma-32 [Limibacillus halophilus]|uniref:RNA polymerase sigma factor n=1 Tax=Limibacillus halophilus TaxID=1579333 RepID=A0A839STX6_9PROT|nr:RNA polymerase factor sigma-32 [Limibacillus halophilus]MBB3065788.1 RNA polymerase sigma-32 factor [Limibacillus halophilus]
MPGTEIQQDSRQANRRLVRKAMSAPILSREQERMLATAWAVGGDEKAMHQLVSAHARLAVSISTKFGGYGLPQWDLIQEGFVGLLQAAMRFDPNRDVRFSTYAVWWIRAAIQDYILRNWSIVRIGTTTSEKSLFFNLRRLRAKIARTSNPYMSYEAAGQIAEELKVRPDQVQRMEVRLGVPDLSVNLPTGEDGDMEYQDTMIDSRPGPEEIVTELRDNQTRAQWLSQALRRLPQREARIIRQRHLGEGAVTLENLGQELGVSKERVRQLEQRALKTLRSLLAERIGE